MSAINEASTKKKRQGLEHFQVVNTWKIWENLLRESIEALQTQEGESLEPLIYSQWIRSTVIIWTCNGHLKCAEEWAYMAAFTGQLKVQEAGQPKKASLTCPCVCHP